MSILLIVPESTDPTQALAEAETLLEHVTWQEGSSADDLLGIWHHGALDRDLPTADQPVPVTLDHALSCGRWSLAWLSGPALDDEQPGQRRRQLIEQLVAPAGRSSDGRPAFLPVLQPGEQGWNEAQHELSRSFPGLLGQPVVRARPGARRAVPA